MNTMIKRKQTKGAGSDNRESDFGFCIQLLRMHIFMSFPHGLVLL